MNREKHIREMSDFIYENRPIKDIWNEEADSIAEALYNAGYRKQSEAEWIEQIKTTTNAKGMTAHYTINFCSNCGYEIGTIRYRHKYCPNCGARMKGGAE